MWICNFFFAFIPVDMRHKNCQLSDNHAMRVSSCTLSILVSLCVIWPKKKEENWLLYFCEKSTNIWFQCFSFIQCIDFKFLRLFPHTHNQLIYFFSCFCYYSMSKKGKEKVLILSQFWLLLLRIFLYICCYLYKNYYAPFKCSFSCPSTWLYNSPYNPQFSLFLLNYY